MQAESRLLTLQRRVLTAVQEPIYADSRSRSALPPREGAVSDQFVATANQYIPPWATLKPVERLELYHRQYWYRLLDSIAEDFPNLRTLLGRDAFWGLMEAYLEVTPSTSFSLLRLGAHLGDFVAGHPDLVPNPVHVEELARIEYALCAAFDAGEYPPVAPADLGNLEIALQPHIQLLALRTNADTVWRRAEHDRPVGRLTEPRAEPNRFVVVYRHALDLYVERIPRAAYEILRAIERTASLERAMDQVASRPGLLRRRDLDRISQWFGAWTSRGWFRSASEETGTQPQGTPRSIP